MEVKRNYNTCPHSTQYRLNGQLHRTDGPAVEYDDGGTAYYVDGLLHRTDGPALEWPGGIRKEYFVNGKRHRIDGPALTFPNNREEYYINGKRVPKSHVDFLTSRRNQALNKILIPDLAKHMMSFL